MFVSTSFVASQACCPFFQRSFLHSSATCNRKRLRHGNLAQCLDRPGRRSTSLSVSDDTAPRKERSKSGQRGSHGPQSPDKDAVRPPRVMPLSSSNGASPAASASDEPLESFQEPSPESLGEASSSVRLPLGPFSVSIPARWLLYSVPFMWGSFGPAVRLLFSQEPHQDPSVFNSERLLLSTMVYVPVLYAELQAFLERKNNKATSSAEEPLAFLAAGVELGVYVFLANVAQVIGLQQTSASRAAFLVQLQTVIVPVLSGIFGLDKISARTWISSVVAVAGVALLSSDKGHGTVASLTGDSLEILSALFFSTYIIRLGKYCNTLPANPLVATKIATQAVLSIGWAALAELGTLFHHTPTHVSADDSVMPWTFATIAINAGVVGWTGLMSSALSGWAQTKGQQGVPASEAVVIFATQPLWASALAALVLGESFGPRGLAGGLLIVGATLVATMKKAKDDKKV